MGCSPRAIEGEATMPTSPAHSELIFLGSGSSTGVPTPICVLQPTDPPCSVCHKAMEGAPEHNKNYRCNPSIMLKYVPNPGAAPRYIQIDCGKCFREQVLRWYTRHKIPRMDALILTHEHADAILGLDDIRGLQPFQGPNGSEVPRTPVFVTQHTMDSVIEKFGYLVSEEQKTLYSKSKASQFKEADSSCAPPKDNESPNTLSNGVTLNGVTVGQGAGSEVSAASSRKEQGKVPPVFRRVTQLDWRLIEPSSKHPFTVEGLEVTPLPVQHGEDYLSLGFEFGTVDRVLYMSDVSRIPDDTAQYLEQRKQQLGRPRIAIIDSLHYSKPHETHFWFQETLEAIRTLQPVTAYMIGMTHQFDHEAVNGELAAWSLREGIHVELSWDGLAVPVQL